MSLRDPTVCEHIWVHPGPRDPLLCEGCGVLWPGHELPAPYRSRNEGYGALADQPGWNERVRTMVSELDEAAP